MAGSVHSSARKLLNSSAMALLSLALVIGLLGCGDRRGPGEIEGARLPEAVVAARAARQMDAVRLAGGRDAPQVLFGDLHVHTTFSADAFEGSLPILGGEGAHPPADACDFARYCADLDFWALTEHAEFLDPQRWRDLVPASTHAQPAPWWSVITSGTRPSRPSPASVPIARWDAR